MGQILEKVFIEVLNMGLTASVMIAGVFLVRLLLKKAPKIYSYVLWSIVLFRLLCPVSFETEISYTANSTDIFLLSKKSVAYRFKIVYNVLNMIIMGRCIKNRSHKY